MAGEFDDLESAVFESKLDRSQLDGAGSLRVGDEFLAKGEWRTVAAIGPASARPEVARVIIRTTDAEMWLAAVWAPRRIIRATQSAPAAEVVA